MQSDQNYNQTNNEKQQEQIQFENFISTTCSQSEYCN
jgi:hypothetical protein